MLTTKIGQNLTCWCNVQLIRPMNYLSRHRHTNDQETHKLDAAPLMILAMGTHFRLPSNRQQYAPIGYQNVQIVALYGTLSYHNLEKSLKIFMFCGIDDWIGHFVVRTDAFVWTTLFWRGKYFVFVTRPLEKLTTYLCFVFQLLWNPYTPRWLNIKPKKSLLRCLIMRSNWMLRFSFHIHSMCPLCRCLLTSSKHP